MLGNIYCNEYFRSDWQFYIYVISMNNSHLPFIAIIMSDEIKAFFLNNSYFIKINDFLKLQRLDSVFIKLFV